MNGYDREIDAEEAVTGILERILLNQEGAGDGLRLINAWRSVVESLNPGPNAENAANFGRNLASHSRIIEIKNGTLLVEADHPAWLQMLKIHQRYIVSCLSRRFPEMGLSSLAFRIRGSEARLSDTYEEALMKARQENSQRYEIEKKMLEERGFLPKTDGEIQELPENLKELFKKLERDILTNERKI